jgi:hypothetical protein
MNALSPALAVVSLLSLSCHEAGVAPSFEKTAVPEAQSVRAPDVSRRRPPEGLACGPNDLTVYTGVVRSYQRELGRTTLSIRTDWDTTETVTIRHAGTDDPSAFFRLLGKPFTAADWPRIERSKGVLRPDVRAAAWVCTNGRVLVEWEVPPE